jgi:hypothetical protein
MVHYVIPVVVIALIAAAFRYLFEPEQQPG